MKIENEGGLQEWVCLNPELAKAIINDVDCIMNSKPYNKCYESTCTALMASGFHGLYTIYETMNKAVYLYKDCNDD